MEKIVVRAYDRAKEDKGWIKLETCFNNSAFKELSGLELNTTVSLTEFCLKSNMGFVPHKHKNKDYIIIPLKGTLIQRTSEGDEFLINHRCLHFMQTGAGITHYEYNPSLSADLVCLAFEIKPEKLNLEPVCETFRELIKYNKINKIKSKLFQQNTKSPINDVSCSWGCFTEKRLVNYRLTKNKNGALLYMIDGVVFISGIKLTKKDTIFIWNTSNFYIIADKKSDFIIFELPLKLK